MHVRNAQFAPVDYQPRLHNPPRARRRQSGGMLLWPFFLAGYLIMGRNFSYWGFAPLFVGEAYLGLNILRDTGRWLSRFVDDVLRFEPLSVAIALQLGWMMLEVFRCLFLTRPPIEVFRTAAFQYYSLFILIGVAIGRQTSLPVFIKFWKITAVCWTLWAGACGAVPALTETKFGFEPFVFPLVPVITVALWKYLRDWPLRLPVLVASMAPTLLTAGRGRGGFLGLSIGIAAVAVSSRERLMKLGLPVVVLIVVMFFVAPFLPTNQQWATAMDPVTHIAGLLATNRPDVAYKLMQARGHKDQAETLLFNEGTANWRKHIWTGAIASLDTVGKKILGQGGGASLQDLVSDGQEIHTPHNFAIFCIYYVGWGGLLVTALLLFSILTTGGRLRHMPLRDAVRANIWATLPVALTGNCLESPGGAIPFYLIAGLLIGLDRKLVADAIAFSRRRRAQQLREIDQSEEFARGEQLQYQ